MFCKITHAYDKSNQTEESGIIYLCKQYKFIIEKLIALQIIIILMI